MKWKDANSKQVMGMENNDVIGTHLKNAKEGILSWMKELALLFVIKKKQDEVVENNMFADFDTKVIEMSAFNGGPFMLQNIEWS